MSRGDLRATLSNLNDILNGYEVHEYHRKIANIVKTNDTSQSSSLEITMNVPLASPNDIDAMHQIR